MAKVVIIAPSDVDVTDAVKILKGEGHDVEVQEPTPKELLHIVLGVLSPNAYGFGPAYAFAPGPEAVDDPDEQAIEGDATKGDTESSEEDDSDFKAPEDDSVGDDIFNFEDLEVNGEKIEAVKTEDEKSVLVVEKLVATGLKRSYGLNESIFSFWPEDEAALVSRVDVHTRDASTSLEVAIREGEKTQLLVGKDLQEILKT